MAIAKYGTMNQNERQQVKPAEWGAEEIRSLRLRLGWSAADFARRFGCLSQLVSDWERGTQVPTSDDILQLQRLSLYVDSYSEQVQRGPVAEQVLKSGGFEQVHNDLLISYLKN